MDSSLHDHAPAHSRGIDLVATIQHGMSTPSKESEAYLLLVEASQAVFSVAGWLPDPVQRLKTIADAQRKVREAQVLLRDLVAQEYDRVKSDEHKRLEAHKRQEP